MIMIMVVFIVDTTSKSTGLLRVSLQFLLLPGIPDQISIFVDKPLEAT
jgi:hypothetical protein